MEQQQEWQTAKWNVEKSCWEEIQLLHLSLSSYTWSIQTGCQKNHQKNQKVVSEILSVEKESIKLLVGFKVLPGLHCMAVSASSCSKHLLDRILQSPYWVYINCTVLPREKGSKAMLAVILVWIKVSSRKATCDAWTLIWSWASVVMMRFILTRC